MTVAYGEPTYMSLSIVLFVCANFCKSDNNFAAKQVYAYCARKEAGLK